MVGFYRVVDYEGPQATRTLAEDWSGVILLPLVDPKSAGGKWLSSPNGRRTLSFKTAMDILIIYPDAENRIDFIDFSNGLCETFAEHGQDLRRVYPDPAVLIVENGLQKCTVVRLCRPSGLTNMKEADLVRRGLVRIIDALINGSSMAKLLKMEAGLIDFVASLDNAAPLFANFARKIPQVNISSLFRTTLETLKTR